jgi:hypothetical protein
VTVTITVDIIEVEPVAGGLPSPVKQQSRQAIMIY